MILLTFRGAVILSLLLFLYYGHDPVLGYGDWCRWRKTTSCLLIRQIHLIWFDALDCESQRGQRDDACFFSPELLPPTHAPPLILYPRPPGVPLHCCSVSGWSLSLAGSRHTSPTNAIKVSIGSVQRYFLTPKTSVSRHCSSSFKTVFSRLRVSTPTIIIIIYCTFCIGSPPSNRSDEIPVGMNEWRANCCST